MIEQPKTGRQKILRATKGGAIAGAFLGGGLRIFELLTDAPPTNPHPQYYDLGAIVGAIVVGAIWVALFCAIGTAIILGLGMVFRRKNRSETPLEPHDH